MHKIWIYIGKPVYWNLVIVCWEICLTKEFYIEISKEVIHVYNLCYNFFSLAFFHTIPHIRIRWCIALILLFKLSFTRVPCIRRRKQLYSVSQEKHNPNSWMFYSITNTLSVFENPFSSYFMWYQKYFERSTGDRTQTIQSLQVIFPFVCDHVLVSMCKFPLLYCNKCMDLEQIQAWHGLIGLLVLNHLWPFHNWSGITWKKKNGSL